jgi:deoxyribodipyrimidine photolyase-like uncharacterized protein
MAKDDLARGLKRLAWEQEPAAQARKEKKMKTLMLQSEMRAARRKLESAGYPDMDALDISPDEFLLTVEHWCEADVIEVLTVLPHLRQMLIDLDQADIFKNRLAVEMAIRDVKWSLWPSMPDDWDGGEWNYERDTYGQEEE